MKKLKFLAILFVATLLLTGCGGSKDKTTKCVLKLDDPGSFEVTTTYTIHHKDNLVTKIILDELIISNDNDVLDYFEEYVNQMYPLYNDTYGGYTYETKRGSDRLTSKVTMDFTKMDLVKFSQNTGVKTNSNNKVEIDEMVSTYKGYGATCD